MRAAFVYYNPRARLVRDIAAGAAPDTALLGQNHLAPHGIEAFVHDPPLTRRGRQGLRHRLTWHLREIVVPLELRAVDVVCTPLALLLPPAARALRGPRPVVFNISLCRRLARASALQRRLVARSLSSAAFVVCFASAQRERLLEQTGLPPERVRVALLGVDERFHRTRPLPGNGYVLAAGRDVARDYGTFARAVVGLDAPAIVVASARNLDGVHLPPTVQVRLDVTDLELRELYEGASCVVIPTRGEDYVYGADCSGQTVLLDAMASGRPVVLSARETNGDYLDRSAIEVPPEDPPALRAAIERVLEEDRLAAQMGAAGRAAVEDRFTTRHLAARLAPLIEEAAGG